MSQEPEFPAPHLTAQANSTSPIENLPTEILTRIFQHSVDSQDPEPSSDSSTDQHHCKAPIQNTLALTSRHFRPVAQALLYKSFYQKSGTKVTKFLQSILLRPDLGDFVRSLDFYLYERSQAWHAKPDIPKGLFTLTEEENTLMERNLQEALASCNNLTLPQIGHWFQQLDRGDLGAISAALLLLCHKLAKLTIWANELPKWPTIEFPAKQTLLHQFPLTGMVLQAITSPTRTQSTAFTRPGDTTAPPLKELTFRALKEESSALVAVNERSLAILCRTSTIETLALRCSSIVCTRRHDFRSIKDVNLIVEEVFGSVPFVTDLEHFARSFRKLEHFSVSYCSHPLLYPDVGRHYLLEHMVQSLRGVKLQLKSLAAVPCVPCDEYRFAPIPNHRLLTVFENLEDLDIVAFDKWTRPLTTETIPGEPVCTCAEGDHDPVSRFPSLASGVIPNKLENLTLREVTRESTYQIRDLLRTMISQGDTPSRSLLPKLKTIQLLLGICSHGGYNGIEPLNITVNEVKKLKVLGAKCGVEVALVDYDESGSSYEPTREEDGGHERIRRMNEARDKRDNEDFETSVLYAVQRLYM